VIPNPVILIGASAGGVTAIQTILKELPENFPIPIVVVQHIPERAEINQELVYSRFYRGKTIEAFDKVRLEAATVYFGPPGYHLLVESDHTLALSQDEPVHFSRPSIDVLFDSAAIALGVNACGVLLTGANADGASGIKNIRERGGITIVQDPRSAEISYMPEAALETTKVDYVLTLPQIAAKFVELAEGKLNA